MRPFIFPVAGGAGRISQLFGPSAIDYSRFGLRGHNGLDFAGTLNEPIYSVTDGYVLRVGYEEDGFGHYVVIDIGEFEALYAHLAERPKLLPGQFVPQGGQIGKMGSSGFSTGAHLHLGVRPKNADRKNGYNGYIDPLPLLLGASGDGTSENAQGSDDGAAENGGTVRGRVEIVCAYGANVRKTPGGEKALELPAGTVLETTGRRAEAHALTYTEVLAPLWIADFDAFGTVILERSIGDERG